MRVAIQNKLPGEAQGFPVLGSVQDWTGKVPQQANLNRPTLSWTEWSPQVRNPNLNDPLILYLWMWGQHEGSSLQNVVRLCAKKSPPKAAGTPIPGCAKAL